MDFLNDFIPGEYINTMTRKGVLNMGVNVIMGVAMTVSFIGLILSGIKYMSSRSGDPRQLESARKALTFSIVGIILSVGAFAILNIILNAVGGSSSDIFGG